MRTFDNVILPTAEEVQQQFNELPDKTLTTLLNGVLELASDFELKADFYTIARPYLDVLNERLQMNDKQIVLFASMMELCTDHRITMQDISRTLHCKTIKVLGILSEMKALIERKLIRQRTNDCDGGMQYLVPDEIIKAIQDDQMYHKELVKEFSAEDFFEELSTIVDEEDNRYGELYERMQTVCASNPHLKICQELTKLDEECCKDEMKVLYFIIDRFVSYDDDNVLIHQWSDFFSRREQRTICNALETGDTPLIQMKIVEPTGFEGIADTSTYHLTDQAKECLLSEINVKKQQKHYKELTKYTTLSQKALFYNTEEKQQIDQLVSLIDEKHFAEVQQRLEDHGMRKGFACLFYGSPGTGKTETVYQLARRTHRDLFVIEVSNIKSKWVGESEQNISKSFADYADCAKRCREQNLPIPILLFNEADAVLGVRREGATTAVDKMENSIQNIILQYMERLDGIMIATTNLTSNLDKAFERRFLYKIEFCKPSLKNKEAIWKSMIPELSTKDAAELASKFDFSGGQIENIARKRTVEYILTGKEPTLNDIVGYCKNELINNKKHAKIGF